MTSKPQRITDVYVAVQKLGGIEKAARLLKVSTESVQTYMDTGYMFKDMAKKLGKATNIPWKLLLTPD
jgi:hypothetical protein